MTMNRRDFVRSVGLGTVGAVATGSVPAEAAAPKAPAKKVRMRLGAQRSPITRDWDGYGSLAQYLARHGVEGVCLFPKVSRDRRWDIDEIKRMREICEAQGMKLEVLGGALSSGTIYGAFPNILLGKHPDRDRDIDLFCDMLRVAAEAGVPCVKYNMSILKVLRTKRTPGRGGATYSTWTLAKAPKNPPLTVAGDVDADTFWERITYFLQKVVPVAEDLKVRLACHPHDPGVPPGYQGVDRVLGTVEGLKRFADIVDSPYHGFNLCIGSTAEMLYNPAEEIDDVVRYFGKRNKIFNIHFRNIRGGRDDFQEVFHDEGDMNMPRLMRTLKEVDYPYLVMADHVPRHEHDPHALQGFAYSFGYIKGLIQAVDSEG